jgi:uncharacterized protein (DUF952 family)
MRLIYHLVTKAVWDQASPEIYAAESLVREGFIHCSNADQVAGAANRFYATADDMLVLHVDAGRLTSLLRDEPSGSGELFPHVYGPINRSAVLHVQTLQRGPEGTWVFG